MFYTLPYLERMFELTKLKGPFLNTIIMDTELQSACSDSLHWVGKAIKRKEGELKHKKHKSEESKDDISEDEGQDVTEDLEFRPPDTLKDKKEEEFLQHEKPEKPEEQNQEPEGIHPNPR